MTAADILTLVLAALACGAALHPHFYLFPTYRSHYASRLLFLSASTMVVRIVVWNGPSFTTRLSRHRFATEPWSPTARELVPVGLLLGGITALALWPQVRHPFQIPEHDDPLFSMWRIAWVAHQLPRAPLHLYDANIFWPARATLANSDGMPLLGAVLAPMIYAGVPLVLTYNLYLLSTFVLSGLAMYGSIRSFTGRAMPALIAAVAYAFYPFRLEHYPHLELLAGYWLPVAFWLLHRIIAENGGWKHGVALGAVTAGQYLTSIYFGILLPLYLGVATFILVIGLRRSVKGLVPAFACAAVTAFALIGPTIPPYLHVRNSTGERPWNEVEMFSATSGDYLDVVEPNRVHDYEVNERQVYPGILIAVLALIALWPPLDPTRSALVGGLAIMYEFSLGSHGWLQPLLYRHIFVFRALRAPARASMFVGFSLAMLSGFGASRVIGLLKHRVTCGIAAAAICITFLVETQPLPKLQPAPSIPPIYDWFAGRQPSPIVVNLPAWYSTGSRYIFDSTAHWETMVNGFSGSVPRSYKALYSAMAQFPGTPAIVVLREYGVQYAIVHEEFYGPREYQRVLAAIDRQPALRLTAAATDGRFESRIYAMRY